MVVVITKESDVADELCRMNGGERIRPMPGCYETHENNLVFNVLRGMNLQSKNNFLIHPTWKPVTWSRDLLIQAVQYEYPPDKLVNLASLDFIEDGMTPLEACNLAAKKIQDSGENAKSTTSSGTTIFFHDIIASPGRDEMENSAAVS